MPDMIKKTTLTIQIRRTLTVGLAVIGCTLFNIRAHAQVTLTEDTTDDELLLTTPGGEEEVIEFPEAMTYDLDSLMSLYMARTYLVPDEDCQTKDENPTYPREVYIDRLRRLPTEMELPYNDIVQKFIDRYTGRLRHSVSYILGAANFYMPIFEEALEAYQLPLELKYLPVIESAMNPGAVSRVGASGLWQFMPATGKAYGLDITTLCDDRRDPVKSSYAAAHYMKDLYKIFGDWTLVIAAYNCGPENINKAIHRAGGERDYWRIYPYLPKETRGYVPAFIAANYVMNYYCEHNICPMKANLPMKTDTIVVSQNVNLAQIAAVLQLDLGLLRSLNPAYRRNIVPGLTAPSAIRLPQEDAVRFIDLQDSIINYNAKELLGKRAEVEVNDTPTFSRRKNSKTKAAATGGRKTVTVRRGDTLSTIARRNGTTVAKLRQLNNIRGNNIRYGQKIRVK